MNAADEIVLRLVYTDGAESVRPLADLSAGTQTDEFTSAELCFAAAGKYTERWLRLRAVAPKALRRVALEFHFSSAFRSGLRFYADGQNTNDWVMIRRFEESAGLEQRGVAVFHGPGGGWNASFTTCDRFFTCFTLMPEGVALEWRMEDRPLEPGKPYDLERFVVDSAADACAFLEDYAQMLADRYRAGREPAASPTGWCSWSCCFKEIDERTADTEGKNVSQRYSRLGADLLQLDDGWQAGGSFCGAWDTDREKFPSGLRSLAERLHARSLRLGLWMAPLIVGGGTDFLGGHPELAPVTSGGGPVVALQIPEGDVLALDLSRGDVLDYLRAVIRRAVGEYGASYLKLDFLVMALRSAPTGAQVCYPGDYSVACYRAAMKAIREAAGEETFLLACGAPVAESAGFFDAIRSTPDIVWSKGKTIPTTWELIRSNVRNMFLRYFYHGRLFVNDPDGVIVRDYDEGHGFDATYEETRLLCSAIGLCGGSALINERIAELGPARLRLFERLLPVYGKAAKPLDLFEMPYPKTVWIDVGREQKTRLIGAFNWGDKVDDLHVDLTRLGFENDCIAFDCWSGKIVGRVRHDLTLPDRMMHSAEVLLLTQTGDEPFFLCTDGNLYGGMGIVAGRWQPERGMLSFHIDKQRFSALRHPKLYLYLPEGYAAEGCETVWSDMHGSVAAAEPGAAASGIRVTAGPRQS